MQHSLCGSLFGLMIEIDFLPMLRLLYLFLASIPPSDILEGYGIVTLVIDTIMYFLAILFGNVIVYASLQNVVSVDKDD